jgi:GNAT superfamily N-acetyltransferase
MAFWRAADKADDAIVEMSLDLYADDLPARQGHSASGSRNTRDVQDGNGSRPRARTGCRRRICRLRVSGLLYSNELGGVICIIDELYVAPARRSRGYATALVTSLLDGGSLWSRQPVALELEVAPENSRAFALYERLGFRIKRNTTMRMMFAR